MRSFGKLMAAIVVAVAVMSCDYSGDALSSQGGVADILNGPDREASSTHWSTGGQALALYADGSGVAQVVWTVGITFGWTSLTSDTLFVDPADDLIFFDNLTDINGSVEFGEFSATSAGTTLNFKLMSGSL